jgi:2-polyprenyl-3-methyl-5-hydroxy-6-metoxy-1,4-benzoquinol methylase
MIIKKIIYPIVHKMDYCLQKELSNCQTVLDLGCGPSSPIKNIKNIKYSVGVEKFKPYLLLSKKQKIHNKYIQQDILTINFPKKSFDAVLLTEVLEHLSKKDGKKLIKKCQKWAIKKIIISTPNGYFPMGQIDKNKYQEHLSGWTINELQSMGFICRGVSGLKFFYTSNNRVDSLIKNQYYQNIRFKPKKIFYFINGIFQIFNYYFPKLTFGIFAVKSYE